MLDGLLSLVSIDWQVNEVFLYVLAIQRHPVNVKPLNGLNSVLFHEMLPVWWREWESAFFLHFSFSSAWCHCAGVLFFSLLSPVAFVYYWTSQQRPFRHPHIFFDILLLILKIMKGFYDMCKGGHLCRYIRATLIYNIIISCEFQEPSWSLTAWCWSSRACLYFSLNQRWDSSLAKDQLEPSMVFPYSKVTFKLN